MMFGVHRAGCVANQFARDSLVLIDSIPVQRLRNVLCGKFFLHRHSSDPASSSATMSLHRRRIFLHACHTGLNLMLRLKTSIPSTFFTCAIFSFDDV